MALYDFKCSECGEVVENIILPMTHADEDHPYCYRCHQYLEHFITAAPMVHWKDYDLPDGGFKAGKDGTVITTRKQNREYMKRHDLLDANEHIKPPTREEWQKEHAKAIESVQAITPTPKQKMELERVGISDIVD